MLFDQVINGLVSGGLYALIALGYTIVFGVLDKLNFAHGEVFMFGGYVGLVAIALGADLVTAAIVVAVVGALFGLLVELVSFRRFKSRDAQITAALSSLLVGLILDELVQKYFGTEPRSLGISPTVYTAGTVILGVQIAYVKLAIFGTALALMIGLILGIDHTRFGREMRAVSESPDAARLMGIDVTRVTQVTFAIASALACVSGLMVACKTGAVVSDIGLTYGLKALAVMAIGGMGDVRGAVIGGLLVGVAEGLTYEAGLGRLAEITVWVLMIAILLLRPSGLLGRGEAAVRA